MTDDSKKNISISSGDVLVAEDKPVLIDEDKVRPQDELQEISVSDFSFPETDENTTVAGDDDTTITLECDTESEEYVEVDKGPHEDELHEEISLSDVIFLESDENTMPARDVVDLDITIEFDTESDEDEVDMDKAPQQDEVEERMELGKGQKISVSDIFCPGEDENTMPLSNVDRNTTNERDKDENIFGGEFKKNISGGQVSQDISAGVVLVDRAKPVLADKDMPLIRSCSTAPNPSMKRMMSVKTERRMAKKRKRDLDEDRSQIEGVIENERMLAKDEDGFVAKYGMPSNELKEDLYDYYS